MENSTATGGSAKPQSPEQRQAVFKEISAKWSKLSEQEVSALKGNADLVSQVVSKYGIPQSQAQSEVDALLKGAPTRCGRVGKTLPRLPQWQPRLFPFGSLMQNNES